jgi:hypothetical protein
MLSVQCSTSLAVVQQLYPVNDGDSCRFAQVQLATDVGGGDQGRGIPGKRLQFLFAQALADIVLQNRVGAGRFWQINHQD